MSSHDRNVSRQNVCLLWAFYFVIFLRFPPPGSGRNVYPLIHHQQHDNVMNYNIPFLSFRFPIETAHLCRYYSNSSSSHLLLFCWLIESDLREGNFRWDFRLIWVVFPSCPLVYPTQRQRRREKIKRQSKSPFAICQNFRFPFLFCWRQTLRSERFVSVKIQLLVSRSRSSSFFTA